MSTRKLSGGRKTATRPAWRRPTAGGSGPGRTAGSAAAASSPASVPVTNPDKVLYPATGFTKRQVVSYYERIAPLLLPHIAGHPLSLKRLPDGIGGVTFFEKRAPADPPAFVRTAAVASSTHGSMTYVVADNLPTLLWLANRAALELHPFLFRAGHEERPDNLVFDLDPGAPATLRDCLGLALEIRDLLHDLGLRAFAKTSGGKGLHLIVPLGGTATFIQAKAFAHATALAFAGRHPERVTAVMAKAARGGRVFIDWSQNDHGKTTVAAYSLRAQERPTVSTPVTWDEVERAVASGRPERLVFDADQVLRRVARIGDPLAAARGLVQRLPSAAWRAPERE